MKNIFLFAGTLVFFFSCQIPGNKKGDAEKLGYELTKEELHAQEKKNPLNFLIVDGQNKHNLIGQMVIKGSITNKASVATFKDVDLKLSFYSKTGAMLESDKETIYEVISPGASKNFKTKYFVPKGADSVAFEILSAKSVE